MEPGHFIPADRPPASTLARTIAPFGVGAVRIALMVVQCFRVPTTIRLLAEREWLCGQLLEVDRWQRRQLSEQLHDEALQYVLAARMDLDDVRDWVPADAMLRIDVALSHASGFLRATVSELRPVVLEQCDLREAVRQLLQTVASDGGLTIALDGAGWPSGARTSADPLLFGIARELLSRVLTRAGVTRVSVSLKLCASQASFQLRVDGAGIGEDELMSHFTTSGRRLAAHRVRVEAAGGRVECASTAMDGTVITVLVPAIPVAGSKTGQYANSEIENGHRYVSATGRGRHKRGNR
jgi:two-component system NarL family sensor kinase